LAPIFSKTTEVPSGERTRWLSAEIKKKLIERGKPEQDANSKAITFVSKLLGGMDTDKPERSKVLFYISEEEKNQIAESLIKNWDTLNKEGDYDKLVNEYKKIFENRNSAPDIALFGRMLADDPKLSMDAACQVAHAISTHRVNMDVDFFTAVDDLLTEEDRGAGMMGVTGFNSACFYRYATIDWEQLLSNLGGNRELALKTIKGFLLASVQAVPTGKQNSFAAQNPPSLLMAVVRKDGMCWSLANAFEKAVHEDNNHSLVENSIIALDRYWGDLERVYGGEKKVFVTSLDGGKNLESLSKDFVENVNNWVNSVMDVISKE